jgi:5'-deoxynucleotidase YfbR-like HD superfamily hydrolase
MGEAVIQEIASVINTLAPDKKPYFSEAEKAEARQLVSSASRDENGIQELRDFKDVLSDLLAQKINPAAAKKAA